MWLYGLAPTIHGVELSESPAEDECESVQNFATGQAELEREKMGVEKDSSTAKPLRGFGFGELSVGCAT
jgi:hypothetical protein